MADYPVQLPVDQIVWRTDRRPLTPAKVESLRVSMRENGFVGAIMVRQVRTADGRSQTEGVYGHHRHTAWIAEGGKTIPALIRALTDDEARQIEIDENLIRGELTPLERAEALMERFRVWGRRFPDRVVSDGATVAPKRGRPSNLDKMSEFLGGAPATMGFAAETAADIGLNEKTVRRAMETVQGLSEPLRQQLHNTWIASNDGVLRQLAARGNPDAQAQAITVLLSGQTKNVLDAIALAEGREPAKPVQTPVDVTVKAFRKLWADASPSVRVAILHELASKKMPDGWVLTGGVA